MKRPPVFPLESTFCPVHIHTPISEINRCWSHSFTVSFVTIAFVTLHLFKNNAKILTLWEP